MKRSGQTNRDQFLSELKPIATGSEPTFKVRVPTSSSSEELLTPVASLSKEGGHMEKYSEVKEQFKSITKGIKKHQTSMASKTQKVNARKPFIDINVAGKKETVVNMYAPDRKYLDMSAYHQKMIRVNAITCEEFELTVPVGCKVNVVHTEQWAPVNQEK